jgi:hypothetical protein
MNATLEKETIGIELPASRYAPDEREFPVAGNAEHQLVFLLRYAVLAASTRNTQPWKFFVSENGIEVFADYTRRLPVADPGNRELLMSVGTAIMNLRVAAARFGLVCRVHYDHSGDSERPLALVSLTPATTGYPVDQNLLHLFPAVVRRHTNRQPFMVSRVPVSVLERLQAVGTTYGSDVHISTDGRINSVVADLIAEADRRQLADPEFRRDIAEWMRPDWTSRPDGLPGSALGAKGIVSALTPWATRVLDLGRVRAAQDRNLCLEAPALIVIAGEDGAPSWLDAGELLERLLLTLVIEGLHTSYFNNPVQVPELRLKLKAILGLKSWPQLMLRVGYCLDPSPQTPRRMVEEMLIERN